METKLLYNDFIKNDIFVKFNKDRRCIDCKSCDFISCLQYDKNILCLRCSDYLVIEKLLEK
jgi:hypothetical protein